MTERRMNRTEIHEYALGALAEGWDTLKATDPQAPWYGVAHELAAIHAILGEDLPWSAEDTLLVMAQIGVICGG